MYIPIKKGSIHGVWLPRKSKQKNMCILKNRISEMFHEKFVYVNCVFREMLLSLVVSFLCWMYLFISHEKFCCVFVWNVVFLFYFSVILWKIFFSCSPLLLLPLSCYNNIIVLYFIQCWIQFRICKWCYKCDTCWWCTGAGDEARA